LACHKYNATVIGINQERDDMNNPYGGTTTPGGKAWKYNCTTRLRFSKGDLLDEDGNKLTRSAEYACGNRVMVGLLKQKGDKPDRRLSFYTLMYEYGIDEIADLIEVALKYGYIQKGGAWFQFIEPETGEIVCDEEGKEIKVQGQSNVAKLLRENDVLLDELRAKIEGAMNG
jgi:recombination protein RecA